MNLIKKIHIPRKVPRNVLFGLLGIGAVAGFAVIAYAQGESSGGGSSGGVGGGGGSSFADMFFIARKTETVGGEKSIEVLGSLLIWFLMLLSMLSIGFIGTMAATNQRKSIAPSLLIEEVKRMLGEGKYREVIDLTETDESFFSKVMNASLREANHGFSAVIRALEQTSDELTTIRLRKIEYLNVLGQVSPMIGLFGTVYGMILAFQAIVATGGNAQPALLAGGIGTALTTTFWGLIVAIPALSGYAIIRNKIDELTTDATLRAEELLNQFRPKPAKPAAGAMATKQVPRKKPSA